MSSTYQATRQLLADMWDMGAVVRVDCVDRMCHVRMIWRGQTLTTSTSSGYDNAVRYAHAMLVRLIAESEAAA